MPKKIQKQPEMKVVLDPETSRGVFADGFGLTLRDGIAILDFGLNTPEGTFRITSRTIMPVGMLKALASEIQKETLAKAKDDKKVKKT